MKEAPKRRGRKPKPVTESIPKAIEVEPLEDINDVFETDIKSVAEELAAMTDKGGKDDYN